MEMVCKNLLSGTNGQLQGRHERKIKLRERSNSKKTGLTGKGIGEDGDGEETKCFATNLSVR